MEDIEDARKHWELSKAEISLLNPNTKTAPVFQSRADAELVIKIYRRFLVLMPKVGENSWGMAMVPTFHMSGESKSFRTANEFTAAGATRDGPNWIVQTPQENLPRGLWRPLNEAKMIHQFDHRFGTFEGFSARPKNTPLNRPSEEELENSVFEPSAWYWVHDDVVRAKKGAAKAVWVVSWRDGAKNDDARSLISCIIPYHAVVGDLPCFYTKLGASYSAILCGLLNSLVVDYLCRLKFSGGHIKQYHIAQLPSPRPSILKEASKSFITDRIIELTYTSHSMAPFARDLGYDGPPFVWDEDRRALLRAELDAWYARAYGLTRDELRYILDPTDVRGSDYPSETFRVLKKNEIARFGEYRTARLVLAAWDVQEARPAAAQ